ncbi:MAG: hypothetical protein WKF57_09175 [Nakamurella sp.]
MPETPSQWYERTATALAAGGHRESDLQQWSSWPWTGELTPKPLERPAEQEPERGGADGSGCSICAESIGNAAAEYLIWRDDLWMIGLPREGSALPFACYLMPRRHADLAELTTQEAARQGELLTLIERAATAVLAVPRVQVARWGDGSEHLHWWLFARPTGQLQLRGTFLSHWSDLLPLGPAEEFRADHDLVAAALVARAGGEQLIRRPAVDR